MKTIKRADLYTDWQFYLANGEWLGVILFTRNQIKRHWPDAKIVKNNVYLV